MPFSMLLNLVGSSNADNKEILWKFINRFHKEINPKNHKILDGLQNTQLIILKIKLNQIKNLKNQIKREKSLRKFS